jgi:hypothetical protein
VSGYFIYREGQLLNAVAINATAFSDTVPSAGTSYAYEVKAVDYSNNLSVPGSTQVDVPAADIDGNGLPDDWELRYFSRTGIDPGADPDGDGLTNLQEFQAGTSPTDFYNGILPTHEPLNAGRPGAEDQLALMVRKPDGTPWANAPVTFQITGGDRRLSATAGGPDYHERIQVRADSTGLAQCFLEPQHP